MGTKFDKIFLADGDLHVEGPFETHGEVYILLNRFLPGVRALFVYAAALAGMRFWRVMLFALGSALAPLTRPVWRPLPVHLGGREPPLVLLRRLCPAARLWAVHPDSGPMGE